MFGRGKQLQTIALLKKRVKELEDKICPHSQHTWASTGWGMDGNGGHGSEMFDYRYQCRKCGKELHTFVPMNTLSEYTGYVGRVVKMCVYDCFDGDVKILDVKGNSVLIEVINVNKCYSCQVNPSQGKRMWINDWLIENIGELACPY